MGEKQERPRCTAKNRQGNRCGRRPHPGATVCVMHGGKAPQVQRKAALRLLELVDPAISTLAKEMVKAEKSSDRIRAANDILDRAGVPRRTEVVEVQDARQALLDRVLKLQAENE